MVTIFVFLNKFVQNLKTQKNCCLKTPFVQKKNANFLLLPKQPNLHKINNTFYRLFWKGSNNAKVAWQLTVKIRWFNQRILWSIYGIYINVSIYRDHVNVSICRDHVNFSIYRDQVNVSIYRDHANVSIYRDHAIVSIYRDQVNVSIYRDMPMFRFIEDHVNVSIYRDYVIVSIYQDHDNVSIYRNHLSGI
jgi:hypothetical protein